ncbi:TetR/AcrR family transcriptional regulator [Sandaracinus amylolyticus]|uniref:Transcriptional regulator, TetR family protein n=1 Tax=Sandaracinus amylolyticus TaxID=927083 RepID=A0A0F6YEW6_9BACT|nr:TetR/AcrR family transcriptional regulator [Sandaracinus amylolyticus]AKF02913.1 Transcriptional regulator, TetR family protein [Sandaracinus amylolyticus]
MVTKGEETRAAVLGHAIALASELGLEGVTIGLLADRAGMSKSGLFAHFKSKESLQLAILEETLSRFVQSVVLPALKKPRGEPRVRALFERWLDFACDMPGGCIVVQAMAELDDRPGPVRDRLEAAQRDWLDTLATAIRIAKEEGHFEARIAPEQLAYEIAALAHGHHLISRMLRDPEADARVRRGFDRLLRQARAAD